MSAAMDPQVPEARSDYLETPNMARLMAEGMRFTSGYSPAPLCTPTRRSILCGTTAARSGSEFKSSWVPASHLTIPNALKAVHSRYRCAHFGKWGEQMISTPEQCGYDLSDGMTGNATGGTPSSLGIKGGHGDGPPHFVDNEDPKRTTSVTDEAIRFMTQESQANHPFFVQVSYYAVHLSVVARQETIDKYQAKGLPDRGYSPAWAAMMDELDSNLGRMLAAIDDLGIQQSTYVVFTSDNGGRETVPGGDSSRQATNYPLTGAKHSLFEGGIRVPLIVRGPGIKAGSVCTTPVAGYDLLPTFYDLAGGEESLAGEIDGTSICPLLLDPDGNLDRKHGALFFHRPGRRVSAVRQGDWKLVVQWDAESTVRSRQLYNVGADPREEGREVAADKTSKAEAMEALLLQYLSTVSAEAPADIPLKRKATRAKRPPNDNPTGNRPAAKPNVR